MATGNKKGAGMVLAGRQLVGIFALLVVMLGVVFTLGYVLGRSQYDTQLRAADSSVPPKTAGVAAKENPTSAGAKNSGEGKSARVTGPDWDFYHAGEPAKPVERLGGIPAPASPSAEMGIPDPPPAREPPEKPASSARTTPSAATARRGQPVTAKTSASRGGNSSYREAGSEAAVKNVAGSSKAAAAKSSGNGAPVIPHGSTMLQVAAMVRRADAVALAQALKKRKFPAFVAPPDGEHLYRVQAGPYVDAQAASAARQRLQEQGFKSIVKR